jgi:DNA topoisomerase-3
MKLVLTEKPSVSKDLATALNATKKKGYFESDSYIITHAQGHLLTLYEPEDYDEKYGEWRLEDLPIIPERFQVKPIEDTKAQLDVVLSLLKRSDVDGYILATDAGREGELIGRLIFAYAKVPMQKVSRFWASQALTPDVIRSGLKNLAPASQFDALHRRGFYRQLSDWTVGINLTRTLTLKLGQTFSMGRVQTAVLSLICARQRAIDKHEKTPYYKLRADLHHGSPFAAYYRKDQHTWWWHNDALLPLVERVTKNATTATVQSVKHQEKAKRPPQLLNLTALQRQMNTSHGFSADYTLQLAQSLYETHKALSYPRTPSRVMGSTDVDFVQKTIAALAKHNPKLFAAVDSSRIQQDNTRVFNDNYLEDHHALMPLRPLPSEAGEHERAVYTTVLSNFAAAFHPDYRYRATTVTLDIDGLEFVATGTRTLDSGWRSAYADQSDDDEEDNEPDLPDLEEGAQTRIQHAELETHYTKPPSPFTDAKLLKAMEKPRTFLEDTDDKSINDVGIGTEATRGSIIETLVKRKYITREKKRIKPTEKGYHLYDAARARESLKPLTQVDETARWENQLAQDPKTFFHEIKQYIQTAVDALKGDSIEQFHDTENQVGTCPVCNRPVQVGPKTYYCTGLRHEQCQFTIPRSLRQATITKKDAEKMLAGKHTRTLTMTSKNGKEFRAKLSVSTDGQVEFHFQKDQQQGKGRGNASKRTNSRSA